MNSRERVRTTLNRKEPDKVPLDLGGNVSGIHIKAYQRLLDYLHIEDNNLQYSDFAQQLAIPCEEVLERFQIDTRYIRPATSVMKINEVKLEYEGKWVGIYDQFGCFWGNSAEKAPEDILYYDPVIHPFTDFKSLSEIKNYDWPDGTDPTPFKGLREYAKLLYETTEYALLTTTAGCVFEYTTFIFGFTKALRYLLKKPEFIMTAMKGFLQYWKDYIITLLNEVGEYLDVVAINGDLAEQAGPWMNIKKYEDIIKPMEKKLSEKVHELTDAKINYHSCGSITQYIPHWAEIGYDACNPVQISAYDMEPCSLKKRFGDIITFWGGLCNSQSILPFGTSEDIYTEVKKNFNCLMPGGGYIASNIHNITAEVPPENIVAMFDAARKFRNY